MHHEANDFYPRSPGPGHCLPLTGAVFWYSIHYRGPHQNIMIQLSRIFSILARNTIFILIYANYMNASVHNSWFMPPELNGQCTVCSLQERGQTSSRVLQLWHRNSQNLYLASLSIYLHIYYSEIAVYIRWFAVLRSLPICASVFIKMLKCQ